jgi:putative copper export protein
MAVLTVRFNYLAWGALGLLLLTGLYAVGDRASDFDLFEVRYGFILVVKLCFAAAAIALTAAHSFVIGPRLLALQEKAATTGGVPPDRIARLRRRSMIISIATLLVGLAIVYMGALLRQTEFSFR